MSFLYVTSSKSQFTRERDTIPVGLRTADTRRLSYYPYGVFEMGVVHWFDNLELDLVLSECPNRDA